MKVYIVISTFSNKDAINETQIDGVYQNQDDARGCLKDLYDYYRKELDLYPDFSYKNTVDYIYLVDNDDCPQIICELEIIEKEVK